MKTSQGRQFRELLQQGRIACLGAYDPVSARIAEDVGSRAIYVSGFAAAAVATGYPDLGLISQTEMAEHIRKICRATTRPVIADGDTGYGGVLNARRTVELWEAAGAAGLHIEDQIFPKRCGHIAGKAVIPPAEMMQKLKAVVAARNSSDFYIIARTDALAVNGLQDAVNRCKLYAETGIDALFIDASESIAQLEMIGRELKGLGKPLVFNSARTGKSPTVSEQDLHELGFDIVIYPLEGLLASHRAVRRAMASILSTGSTASSASEYSSFKEINALVGLDDFVATEASFATKES